jgi:hypothetical protein
MVSKENAPSAVTNTPPEVAPGIPAVEVDPTNELLDGENLEEKQALLEDEAANVQVDPSGRRLESKDAAKVRDEVGTSDDPLRVIPPPSFANLELRKRVGKDEAALKESIGQGEEKEDSMVQALSTELEGLQRRADDGDEKAGRRVSQVQEQLSQRKSAAESGSQSKAPEGRSATPPARQTTAKKTAEPSQQ